MPTLQYRSKQAKNFKDLPDGVLLQCYPSSESANDLIIECDTQEVYTNRLDLVFTSCLWLHDGIIYETRFTDTNGRAGNFAIRAQRLAAESDGMNRVYEREWRREQDNTLRALREIADKVAK
jgi:hypothetical protein